MRKEPKTSLLCCRHLMLHLEKPIKLHAYPLLQEITETNPVKDLIGPGRANDQPSHFVYEYHLPSLSMANALNNKLIDSRTEIERDEGWMVLSDKNIDDSVKHIRTPEPEKTREPLQWCTHKDAGLTSVQYMSCESEEPPSNMFCGVQTARDIACQQIHWKTR